MEDDWISYGNDEVTLESMETRKLLKWCLAVLLLVITAACGRQPENGDLLLRSRIDGYNKDAFLCRYRDPMRGLALADSALTLINDSMPKYKEGYLRACNNKAYCKYMLSDYDSMYACTAACFDSMTVASHPASLKIEQLIAQLLEARVKQRQCYTAESYQILYDIDHSKVLERSRGEDLHDFALMEYYITSITLNYFFRYGALDNVRGMLNEIEEVKPSLRCDYAQDISLNYAMAHSYYKLCDSSAEQKRYLRRALELCEENLTIISDSTVFDPYHLANVYQLLGLMRSDTLIREASWDANADVLERIYYAMDSVFHFNLQPDEDFTLALFVESTELFWLLDDPYQRLGAAVTVADYAMTAGDTALARYYYLAALYDTTLVDFIAPKFEQRLYAGLINSGAAENDDELRLWFAKEISILDLIRQNERDDFLLQRELSDVRKSNRLYVAFFVVVALLVLVLAVLLWQLVRKTRALQEETRRLQIAKEQDVERIANVETCLSVLRHDINPFISYLQNKNLPEQLKQEVLGRMTRTFDNIKAWTTISLPGGLQFRPSRFALQEVFDTVDDNILNAHPHRVSLVFHPTTLRVWGDSQLLVILLRNLVSNAVQHTSEGSIQIVAKHHEDDGRFVEVTVTDTGCGMAPDEVEDLFRTDKNVTQRTGSASSGASGNGFGLILCRYIIKQHDDHTVRGCRIWAESEVGKGSVMHFLVALDDKTAN